MFAETCFERDLATACKAQARGPTDTEYIPEHENT